MDIAFTLLDYQGTEALSAEDIKAEFYKLGITHSFQVTSEHTSWMLSGLEENIAERLEFLFNYIQNLEEDQEIYEEVIATILEAREYNKKDKGKIMSALSTYTKFGKNSRLRNLLSKKEMQNLNSKNLIQTIQNLLLQPYEVFFYGKNYDAFLPVISKLIEPISVEIPAPKIYEEIAPNGKYYFTAYDMVQVELLKIGQSSVVDPYKFMKINIFNEYFGRGLSSIIFQELRESRSLAYSAYVSYAAANLKDKHNYITAYIGTQPDKLVIANDAINDLMENFPLIESQFLNAKNTILKQIASSRINRQNIFFKNYNQKKLGIFHDLREDIYKQIGEMKMEDLNKFYQEEIQNVKYNTALMGNLKDIVKADPSLESRLEVLSLEELFNY